MVKTIALQTEGKISNDGENHGYILDVCLILYGPFFQQSRAPQLFSEEQLSVPLLGPYNNTCALHQPLCCFVKCSIDYREATPFFVLLGGVRTPRAGDGGLSLDKGA